MQSDKKIEGFWESQVAERLGVPRKVVAALRKEHLLEGPDFVRGENNAVVLSAAGLAKLEAALRAGGGSPGKPAETGGKPAADLKPGPPRREEMTVRTVSQHNPKILLCETHLRTAAMVVAVRVRENTNFTAGMVLEAIESHDGVWQFRNRPHGDESTVGRLPRGKGRW